GVAEGEGRQPGDRLLLAGSDGVGGGRHGRREVVVDELGEVALQQRHHREGGERRHQGGALLEHVPPVLDGGHDRRIGGGTTHAQLLQPLDQRRLGVAGRWLGGVPGGLETLHRQVYTLLEGRQDAFLVVCVLFVPPLDVRREESRE